MGTTGLMDYDKLVDSGRRHPGSHSSGHIEDRVGDLGRPICATSSSLRCINELPHGSAHDSHVDIHARDHILKAATPTVADMAARGNPPVSEHMDNHERPYKCNVAGCEKLRGFTYAGGLLRHGREVYSQHGWPKEPLDYPQKVTLQCSLIPQPKTGPITQEQLVAEVKGIYAGLVMVESKCIEVDNAQSSQTDTKLNEQRQALIASHRTLLHEHHDFFLASQHPSSSPALRRLASEYAMPARIWRHGIHSFLELLHHRLPASQEHMLAFIYLAYCIMALLYETVLPFGDIWIECLGDLDRYRMAIEDDDIRDREVWTAVSRNWYAKASDKASTTGRLYHHLAIVASPNHIQQLFYNTKSLILSILFGRCRESIMTLFGPFKYVNAGPHCRMLRKSMSRILFSFSSPMLRSPFSFSSSRNLGIDLRTLPGVFDTIFA
ncbi:hypothetical protein F5Y16DRAFT_196462 [Xylariaceae sp. FL0255]|nr:hypothetical protein F5Y16DRAFT_196462 [Xylariaceae sp. FL0255]